MLFEITCQGSINVTGSRVTLALKQPQLRQSGDYQDETKIKCIKKYNYGVTATKNWFHFQFPRSPDAAFGGHIGRLLSWKFEFGYRMVNSISNYVKYNYFEIITAWIMSRYENS